MEVIIIFIYEKRDIKIQCKANDEIKKIYQKFVNKINPNLSINDFDFFYNANKVDKDIKNLQDLIPKNIKEITIFVEKRSKIVKCPKCICNECIIDINDYIIHFYGCKYKHTDFQIFDDYKRTQKIDFSQIFCKKDGCDKNQSNDPEDFYKCLTCCKLLKHTQYYCNFHSKEHDKNNPKKHLQVKYDQKNYFCDKHFQKYVKYCFNCRKNLCQDCSVEHKNHSIKDYDSMSPIIKEIKNDLDKIKEKMEELKIIIVYIKRNLLDGTMKIYENYCEILNDIIEKYEFNNKEFKNYGVLKNFLNLKKSNQKIMNDLEEIINDDNYKKKAYLLIDKFQKDLENYKHLQINNNNNNLTFEAKTDDLNDLNEWEGKNNKSKEKNENILEKKKSGGQTKGKNIKQKNGK